MSDDLLTNRHDNDDGAPASNLPSEGEIAVAEAPADRPKDIPEKFWDPEKRGIRTDALLKSYQELERKLGRAPAADVPASPDEYQLKIGDDLMQIDPEVNARLHSAGFSHSQAQLVYDLALERLVPMVTEVASVYEAESQTERLVDHFGGRDAWREAARQISAWGRASMPQQVFEALSTTYEGVLAMHRMMGAGEPSLVRDGATAGSELTEVDLKQMMRDPRYWRDQDPTIVEKVKQGFRNLYPE